MHSEKCYQDKLNNYIAFAVLSSGHHSAAKSNSESDMVKEGVVDKVWMYSDDVTRADLTHVIVYLCGCVHLPSVDLP